MSSANQRLDVPKFSQTIAIIRDVQRRHPTACAADLTEWTKLRHLELGFQYDNDQIHRALSAVLHGPSPVLRSDKRRWDRSP